MSGRTLVLEQATLVNKERRFILPIDDLALDHFPSTWNLSLMPIESCRCVLVRQRGHRPDVDAPALHTRLFNIEQAGSFGAALLVIQ